ncbi:rhomboid family intramembrane serine protease [Leptospira wolffii]|uniref:Rhomboid family intramembrane serine protease n=1 Tax=Leptospira wolffii TaxID=409998 RepID=A0A2M9ZGC4_9LEPT|nr:rhomboid family intramembrane serine protease [Leptospira wolffii]PJZ67416.1 rhomboid family intramembrane serine protease [Leptospira wolffii]TGK62415.1 rhomboid family intramembrane serine protease [Leptospira wolffii]TGK70645.1 rhomboid family intramembrane serine protease [Leptospira wolffii]TGK74201.1 rhomboid family intramembrane serine protease [Leptospira wolffii]TGL32224.1 rhomboid family intramembrane serine protease [Leptospira wolffii]
MITEITIAITTIISLYTLYKDQNLLDKLILRPYRDSKEGNYYTLATSGFVHADLQHLIFNMITLYFFGQAVDNVLGATGFMGLYLASILVANSVSYFRHKDDPNYGSLGASGGTSGIVFASILFFPYSKIFFFLIPVPIPGPLYALFYLAYSYYASKNSQDGINHDAHFYGALTGLAVAILARPESVERFLLYLAGIFL